MNPESLALTTRQFFSSFGSALLIRAELVVALYILLKVAINNSSVNYAAKEYGILSQ